MKGKNKKHKIHAKATQPRQGYGTNLSFNFLKKLTGH